MMCDKYYNYFSVLVKKRYDFYFFNILWLFLIMYIFLVDDLLFGIKMCVCKMSV